MLSTRLNRLDHRRNHCSPRWPRRSRLLAQTPEHTGDNAAQFPSKTRSEIADDVRQLSGRAPRQRRARRGFRGGVLSLGAAHRSEEQRTARPRLHLLAGRWRHRRGGQACRPHPDDRQVQPRRAAGRRRARPQAEEISGRAAQHQPVDPRTDHRPGGDAAVGLGELRRGRRQGGGRQHRQADRPGMVSDLQGSARRHDPRISRQGKGSRHAVRARLQARRFRCCAWPTPMRAGCRATRTARRRPASTRRSTRSCRGIRWCRKALRETKAGKKLPPLVDSAQAGAAEALYGIGATLTRRGGEDLALVYLQLALYLQPNHPLALLSLADLYESVKKPQMAIKVYERMPASSPLKRNAQIQLATNLDAADRSDEAIKILKGVTARGRRRISKPSWRSAISSAAARSSPIAPRPIRRPSTRCPG